MTTAAPAPLPPQEVPVRRLEAPRAPDVRPQVAAACAAGAVAVAASAAAALRLDALPASGWALAGALGVLCLLLQLRTFNFPWRAQRVAITLDEVVVLAHLLLLPAPLVVPVTTLAVAVSQPLRARPLRKALFNTGAHAAAAGAAWATYALAAPSLALIPAALAGTAVYTLVTNGAVAWILARVEGSSTLRVVRERFVAPTLLQLTLSNALVLALVALWRLHPLATLAVVPFALLAREHMALRALEERKEHLRGRLWAVARGARKALDEDELARSVLELCDASLRAHAATLALDGPASRRWSRTFGRAASWGEPLRASLRAHDGRRLGELEVLLQARGRERAETHRLLEMLAAEAAALFEASALMAAEREARDEAQQAAAAKEVSLRQLAEREAQLRAILDHAPAAVFVKDLDGRFRVVNRRAEEASALPPGALVGKDDFDLFPRDVAEHVRAVDAEVVRTGEPRELEARPPGGGVYHSLKFPIRDESGRTIAVGTIATDVTDRIEAQRQLDDTRAQLAANEKLAAMGSLVSGVAHEVRTPLTYLLNSVYLARQKLERLARATPERARDAEELSRLLAEAEEGAERVSRLVGDLRRFIQTRPQERGPVRLDETVDAALRLFAATHRADVRVVPDLAPTPPLELDSVQVQQVVLNLLQNAAEAKRDARVRVYTRAEEGMAEVGVEDDGPGIPDEVAARMWEPFYTTKPDGTGLGLAIVRRIVESHGGSIAHERGTGGGARFVVRFPLGSRPA